MKKILCCTLFMILFFSVQVKFGDTTPITITATENPLIPIIKGRTSNYLQEVSIAAFDYAESLKGDISSASIEGQWGGKKIAKISKFDLYLDDTLLIDFDQYLRGLSKAERKVLKRSLKHGKLSQFNISIEQDALADLEDGEAHLYLVGKPKFFSALHLEDITLRIVDPIPDDGPGGIVDPIIDDGPGRIADPIIDDGPGGIVDPIPDNGPGPQPVPEPATLLLLSGGLIGLVGFGRRKSKD